MIQSIELQVISKILTSEDDYVVEELLKFDASYYSIFKPQIEFIINHREKYGKVPDRFTFQVEFPDVDLVSVDEPLEYLTQEMRLNKKAIILRETFSKIKDLGLDDVAEAWKYIGMRWEESEALNETDPMNIITDSEERAHQIQEYSKQARIPTGFPEIDEVLYGGLSTVEELCIVFARTNTGKTWVLSKMMESAQRHGFPSLYYSPEMQPCYLATRFDSWRGGFHNSDIIRGIYDEKYQKYLKGLPMTGAPAYVLEDSDSPSGVVDVPLLTHYVRKYKIKMLIIDGLSYMEDVHSTTATAEHIKFKNLAHDLFRLSKRYGCCVLVAMQANRETRNNAEKNGDAKEPMPGLHNIESSDQPGRICTTAIALRQIWAAQTMDMKIQKSRNSKKPDNIYTYNWDPNTGTASLKCIESASGGEDQEDPVTAKDGKPKAQGGANNYQVSAPGSFTSISSGSFTGYTPTVQEDDHDVRDDEDVEF